MEIHWKCKYELPTSKLSKVIACQTDRQVTRGHFRSRDKDGSHTTRSAVVQNPRYAQT